MSTAKLEKRLALLENEVARLKGRLEPQGDAPWWDRIGGAFANDSAFKHAMKLGRDYRESLRPGRAKTGKRRGDSRH